MSGCESPVYGFALEWPSELDKDTEIEMANSCVYGTQNILQKFLQWEKIGTFTHFIYFFLLKKCSAKYLRKQLLHWILLYSSA